MLNNDRIHLDSWGNGKVLVNMTYYPLGEMIMLERIRGRKPSYKHVRWGVENSFDVTGALLGAVLHPPTSTMPDMIPVAKVPTRFCTMSVDWIPYEYDRAYALRLQQESGRSVAIELENVSHFATWVLSTILDAQIRGIMSILRNQAC